MPHCHGATSGSFQSLSLEALIDDTCMIIDVPDCGVAVKGKGVWDPEEISSRCALCTCTVGIIWYSTEYLDKEMFHSYHSL